MIGAGAFFCFTFSWVCGLSELLAGAILNQLDRANLLICDEAGYLSFSRSGAELLFQMFADRYGRRSLLITSNLAFSNWGTIFEGERMTAALTDARPAVESESQEVNVF